MANDKAKCALVFGSLMAKYRELKGFQQREVANMLGISQAYYCYLEKGQRNIDLHLAIEVSKTLGFSLDEFVRTCK